jgi:phytoene synthase
MTQALLDELPPAQRLALAYAPRQARPETLAFLALDARLATLLRRRGEPVLAQMRLAWWRDVLQKDKQTWPKGEALLALLRDWDEPRALIPLVDGWEALLAESFDKSAIDQFVKGRVLAARRLAVELGLASGEAPGTAAAWWALGDLGANLSEPAERTLVVGVAATLPPSPPLQRDLRSFAVLAALAKRSLVRGGRPLLEGPGAMLLAMRVGIGGR